jgi:hypothetical protein
MHAADETSDEELKSLKEELAKVAGSVKKLENELEALLAGGVTSPVVLGSPAKGSREQAREERALLGGGDMDTIDEEEPASPAPVYSPFLRRGVDGERGEESAEAGGKDTDGKTSAEPGADAGGSGSSAEAKGGKGTSAAEAKHVQEQSEGEGDGDKAKAGGEEKSAKDGGAGVEGEGGDKVKAAGEDVIAKDGGAGAESQGGERGAKAGGEENNAKDGGAGAEGGVGDKEAKASGEKSAKDGGAGGKGKEEGEKGDASKDPKGE